MRNTWTLFRREFAAFWLSPIAYVVLVVHGVLMGFAFWQVVAQLSFGRSELSVMWLFFGLNWPYWLVMMIVPPVLTMRLFSEEYRSGTIEGLLTAPVRDAEVVAAKYLAALAYFIVLWLPSLAYCGILEYHADFEWVPVLGGYGAVLLFGMAFISVGTFTSTLSRNQIVAAILSLVATMACFMGPLLLRDMARTEPGQSIRGYVDMIDHVYTMNKGILDTRTVIYYLGIMAVFLYLTSVSVSTRRWGVPLGAGGGAREAGAGRVALVLALAGAAAAVAVLGATLAREDHADWLLGLLAAGAALVVAGGAVAAVRQASLASNAGLFAAALVLGTSVAGYVRFGRTDLWMAAIAGAVAVALAAWSFAAHAAGQRRLYLVTQVAMLGMVCVVNLGMANWVSNRHYARLHLSEAARAVEVGERTKGLVQEYVKDQLELVAILPSEEQLYTLVQNLLESYRALAADRIQLKFFDPRRDANEMIAVIQRYGITSERGVIVHYGDNTEFVVYDDLAEWQEPDWQSRGQEPRRIKEFKAEARINAAILKVTSLRQDVVSFLSGHGERDPDGYGDDSLSTLKKVFTQGLNAQVKKLDLTTEPEVPEDCDLLVVAGPAAPIPDEDANRIARYLDRGGRVLAFLDPVLERSTGRLRPTGLEQVLERRGVDVQGGLAADPQRHYPQGQVHLLVAQDWGYHASIETLRESGQVPCYLPYARPIESRSGEGYTSTVLLRTGADAWVEDLRHGIDAAREADERGGALGLAVASEEDVKDEPEVAPPAGDGTVPVVQKQWRVVVVGDVDFATDKIVKATRGTTAEVVFLLASWILEKKALLGEGTRTPDPVKLELSKAQLDSIFWIVMLGMPLGWAALGLGVWYRRTYA
ncbi:MAG: Gldg family protein [Planctomycetes bacterium]|nr:Gldg family protein [Planctomycetota bacterium]